MSLNTSSESEKENFGLPETKNSHWTIGAKWCGPTNADSVWYLIVLRNVFGEAVKSAWYSIKRDDSEKLILSVPGRLREAYKNNGVAIPY